MIQTQRLDAVEKIKCIQNKWIPVSMDSETQH